MLSTQEKKSIFLLDLSIFFTELGVYVTWIGLMTHAGTFVEAISLISALWFSNRIQRVLLAGFTGSIVDMAKDKILIFKISAVGYALTILVFCFLDLNRPQLLIALTFILPIYRLLSTLARVAYVKNMLEGEELKKQVRFMETLPMAGSGIGAVVIVIYGDMISFEQILWADFVLHLISFFVIFFIKKNTNSQTEPAEMWSVRKEIKDTRAVIEDPLVRSLTLELYALIALFGSYPVVVTIISSAHSAQSKIIYSSYSLGLALGSLIALLAANAINRYHNILYKLLPWATVAAFLQAVSAFQFDLSEGRIAAMVFAIGTFATAVFVMYLANLRAEIANLVPKRTVASTLAIISRFEFLLGACLAYSIGIISDISGIFSSAVVMMAFIIPMIYLRLRFRNLKS
jgi:hypothetical protein